MGSSAFIIRSRDKYIEKNLFYVHKGIASPIRDTIVKRYLTDNKGFAAKRLVVS